DLSSVKVWICTGAPFSYEKIRDFEAHMPGRILQGYGMTETTSACAVDDLSIERPPGSCGRILKDVEVVVRDEAGKPLPPGEIGEITCRSDFNVSGYLDNPEADKEAFRDGWLWTGDMGYQKDGHLYFMDRKKRMICVNTSKVYPTRVEEAVFALGLFREVACVGAPSATTVEAPVVFFVKKEANAQLTTPMLQGMLKNVLRSYEVPVDFVEMDALPRQNAIKLNYIEMAEIYKKRLGLV
ncbi:MAG: AMP-binding protein, partial [Bdellovibrionales bacterium]|nr:AMP-binding protein [Bdellovibrionales bacterium]